MGDAGTWTHSLQGWSELGVSFCQEPEEAVLEYSARSCYEVFFLPQIPDRNEMPVVRDDAGFKEEGRNTLNFHVVPT